MRSNLKIKRVCQHCGNEFIAKTTVTRYCGDVCSKRAYKARKKAEKIKSSNEETKAIIEKPIIEIQSKDFLSVQDVCKLFDVSRTTVWRLMKDGKVDAAKIGRKKFITRKSINKLFAPPVAEVKEAPIAFNIEDCYYMGEVQELFGVSEKALYDVIKRFKIQKFQKGKYVYVTKQSIIDIFGEPQQ